MRTYNNEYKMTGPPKAYNQIIILSPTPSFLERADLPFANDIKQYEILRMKNSFWQRNSAIFDIGLKKNPSEAVREISDLGYERHRGDIHKGEFFQQGGLITIFPINHSSPITLEFSGNAISSIEETKIIPHEERLAHHVRHPVSHIEPGDFVVHEDHGIGIFRGYSENKILNNLKIRNSNLKIENQKSEKFLILEYAPARKNGEPDKLLIPEKFQDKITPYLGLKTPQINRLGTPLWENTKRKAKEDIIVFAKELFELYKKRESQKRAAYEDNLFEKEVWDDFEFKLTESQEKSLEEIFSDLDKDIPMERLVVGDVGFGKTELALRTAFRAVINKKQVAILSPTTVLCDQHLETFTKRLEPKGVNIKKLTRLQSHKKVKEILLKLAEGKIDIIIGTHKILSKNINFKNLGLLIIDEEQKFGVKHKEVLKQKYPNIDILYLSATPIPRTLAFSFSKIRPMSLVSDPPEGRIPIMTFVLPKNEKIIKEAISNELSRNGQIYFLSPRIMKMPFILKRIEKAFPKTKKAILHGRMSEKKLLETMHEFREGKIKILISTTIIENGLDISSANTLIVDDATRLGLAQSHQLRGRIGRSNKQAYAYFLYSSKSLTPKAEERLEALLDFQQLGAGFEIAKRDLELRGAGNILGREQSGVVNRIGWNLYFQYLGETLDELM